MSTSSSSLCPARRAWEAPLADGLRILELEVRSHVISAALALPLLVRSEAPLHVEVTDGTAASHRRYRENGLGEELAEYGGAAVAVTPGFMRPEQMLAHFGVSEENWRDPVAQEPAFAIAESPHYLARAVAAMAADPDRAVRWNRKSVPSADLARAYGVRDVDGSQPDAWAYFEDTRYGGINGSADEYR